MRIAIDARKIDDFGIGTYVRGLLRGLVSLNRGDEIVALAPARSTVPAGVEHVVLATPPYSLREVVAVGRAARRVSAELLHAPHYVTPFTTLPLVVTIHDLIHLHQPMRNPLAPLYARITLRRAIRNAAQILTVSATVREQLIAELGADASRITVTPNGVDPRTIAGTGSEGSGNEPCFLLAGNDKPHKNVEGLVTAFAKVRKEIPEARLVLAGSPFERFRSQPGVRIVGFVDEQTLAALYAEATAVVVPSHEEGFGLPAMEAMAYGTAVITSSAPALIELTGDAAVHVDARDDAALAAAMVRVARSATLRAELRARGLARSGEFTWTRCAELTRAAYDAALGRF